MRLVQALPALFTLNEPTMGLSAYLAPHITGTYDFFFVPLALPSSLVLLLLSSIPSALTLAMNGGPATSSGQRWVVIEAGKQIETGVGGLPGGKSTFYEAKLEIPYLTSINQLSHSRTLLMLKHTVLLSSRMMAFSSSLVTGLRSHYCNFEVNEAEGTYEVKGWIKITPYSGGDEDHGWTETQARQAVGSWWVGERSGHTATRFVSNSPSPPSQLRVLVELHLPSFTQLSLEETLSVATTMEPKLTIDNEGWLKISANSWAFLESTKMEVKNVSDL